MSETEKRAASQDNAFDADPLNDLVRLLNDEDPFADFAAAKAPPAAEAAVRRMPAEVQMQAPLPDLSAEDEAYYAQSELPAADPRMAAYSHPAEPAFDYAAEAYQPVYDSHLEPGEPIFEDGDHEAEDDEPYLSAQPQARTYDSFSAYDTAQEPYLHPEGEADLHAYDDGYGESGSDQYHSHDAYAAMQEPGFAAHDHHADHVERPAEASFGAQDLRGGHDDGHEPALDPYEYPSDPHMDDALSRSLAAELEQSYFNALNGDHRDAAYDTRESSLSIDEDFAASYQSADGVYSDYAFEGEGRSAEELADDHGLADSLAASLQASLDAGQAFEPHHDQSVEPIFAQDGAADADVLFADADYDMQAGGERPESEESVFDEPLFDPASAMAAGTVTAAAASFSRQPAERRQSPEAGAMSHDERAASILELASAYEREAAARDAAKRAKADAMAEHKAASSRPEKRRRSALPLYGGIAAAVLLVAGGAYALLSGGVDDGFAPPPIIKADTDSFKTVPEGQQQAANADEPGRKLIYDRVSGNETRTEERIVPRQEDVLPVQNVAPAAAPVAPDQNLAASAPRRVQSVSITPDGAIVRAPVVEPQVPVNLAAPVAPTPPATPAAPPAPNQVATPGQGEVRVITTSPVPTAPAQTPAAQAAGQPVAPVAATQPPQPPASLSGELRTSPAAPAQPQVDTQAQASTEQSEETPPIALAAAPLPPSRTAIGTAPAARTVAPVALQNPVAAAGTPTVDARAALQQAQAATSAPVQQPVAVPNAASGGFVVQLSASRSEQEALSAYTNFQNRFPALANRSPNIQRADLGNRGIYYRLGVGPLATRDDANNLCSQLRAQGLSDCFVRAN